MNNIIKKIISFLCILIFINTGITKEIDKIIATVNNDIILKSDVNRILTITKKNAAIKNEKLNEKNLFNQILNRLIINKIILQKAKNINFQINDKILDKTINDIASQNGITLNQLKNKLLSDNISFKEYRNNIREEMIIAEIRNYEINKRIKILPQEINLLVSQIDMKINKNSKINISYIFIPISEKQSDKENNVIINFINNIMSQIKQGIEFNKLNLHNVIINNLEIQEMGWKNAKELPNNFIQHIQYAKKGDIINPIRSKNGIYILKINDVINNYKPIFINEIKSNHIFIKTSPLMNDEKAHLKIQTIANQIENGTFTFDEAKKKFSQKYDYFLNNDISQWHMIDIYSPELQKIITKLKIGETSKPIHSSFGWHLIKLINIRKVDKTNIIKKNYAYQILFNRKFNEEMYIWIQEQLASAYIKYF